MSDMSTMAVFLTFRQLYWAMEALHQGERAAVDSLHDIWKLGAPHPHSIIVNPKGYDERKAQKGNFESRLLLPPRVVEWIVEWSGKRGYPYSTEQAQAMLEGRAMFKARETVDDDDLRIISVRK